MTPNKDNLRAWVKALRSGEYEQGEGLLRNYRNEFCCLGVACDISGVGEWEDTDNRNNGAVYATETTGAATTLPYEVREWLGVAHTDPSLQTDAGRVSAAGLNDRRGYTFEQIADAIERTYEL